MARELSGLTSNGAPGKRHYHLTNLNHLRAWNMLPWVPKTFHGRFQVSVNFFKVTRAKSLRRRAREKKSLVPRIAIESFRFEDENNYEYEIFSILSIAHAWTSVITEIKIHVYRKRQTSDSSWEFLRIENKQITTVPNDSYGENWHKTTYFCVKAIKSKRKIRGKLGHVIQILISLFWREIVIAVVILIQILARMS